MEILEMGETGVALAREVEGAAQAGPFDLILRRMSPRWNQSFPIRRRSSCWPGTISRTSWSRARRPWTRQDHPAAIHQAGHGRNRHWRPDRSYRPIRIRSTTKSKSRQ